VAAGCGVGSLVVLAARDGGGGSMAGSSIFQREDGKNKEESKIVNAS
jgi:hypothetical protein